MNHSFFTEFKNVIFKEHLKKNELTSDTIIEKLCYLGEIDQLDKETDASCRKWFDDVFRFNLIRQLISHAGQFEELVIHNARIIQKNKETIETPFTWGDDDIFHAFQFFCDKHDANWNTNDQFASFNALLDDASYRFTLIHPSLNPYRSTKAFIRSQSKKGFSVGDFTKADLEGLIRSFVLKKKNLMISGPAGAGKTGLLRAMLDFVPPSEHVVVIEDAGEIKLDGPFVSYLVSPDQENLKSFCAYALRMSPDRIVLGEIRSHEVVPFILSSNTGHRGMISTIHANSAVDATSRLSVLFSLFSQGHIRYESIQRLIHKNIEYVIHVENKEIIEIVKIIGFENDKTIYDCIYNSTAQAVHGLDEMESAHF